MVIKKTRKTRDCHVVNVQQTLEAWRNVFYVTAGIQLFGAIFFVIFGSGELQPWAMTPQQRNDDVRPVGEDESGKTPSKA